MIKLKQLIAEGLDWVKTTTGENVQLVPVDYVRASMNMKREVTQGMLMPVFKKGEKVAKWFIKPPSKLMGRVNLKGYLQPNGKIKIITGKE